MWIRVPGPISSTVMAMGKTRIVSVALSLFVAAAMLTAAPPANAILPTFSVTYSGAGLSPSSLPDAQVGDIVEVTNTSTDTVDFRNATGQLSDIGGLCNGIASMCTVSDGITWTFEIDALGTVSVLKSPSMEVSATLTLGPTNVDPDVPTNTMTFNGNGSVGCDPQSASGPSGSSYSLPSAHHCIRFGYDLLGWSANPDATAPENANLTQPKNGDVGPVATFSGDGTLYAVWRPVGARITYDANVGLTEECLADGVNLTTASARKTAPEVVAVGSATATSAPCNPLNQALVGWATTSSGPSIVDPGAALPSSITSDSSATLYAVWRSTKLRVIYDANVKLDRECMAGGRSVTSASGRRTSPALVPPESPASATAPCLPPHFALRGWATTSNGQSIVDPGSALPGSLAAGDSVTLFAVWRPTKVQVTYDANVKLPDECLVDGKNVPSESDRLSSPTMVSPLSAAANEAPCAPPDLALWGWSTTPKGKSTVAPGAVLPSKLSAGKTVMLFAVWGPPCSTGYAFNGGDGSGESPFRVASAFDLNCLREQESLWRSGVNFVQSADIDMGGLVWASGIGNDHRRFNGSYDGTSHSIRQLTVNGESRGNIGLFGVVGPLGTIDAVRFTGTVMGGESVGGLVGVNTGRISDSTSAGSVQGSMSVGGLVGHSTGAVSDSASTADVTGQDVVGGLIGWDVESGGATSTPGVTGSHASGVVSGRSWVGGLIGLEGRSVEDCYATGKVTAAKVSAGGLIGTHGPYGPSVNLNIVVSNSYASGNVSAPEQSGGLVGSSAVAVSGSHATGDVTGGVQVGGLVGLYVLWNVGAPNSSISTSFATGNVTGSSSVGGLVGDASQSITDSYATGDVRGRGKVGGLVGWFRAPDGRTSAPVLTTSFAVGAVSLSGASGGLVGSADALTRDSFWNVETSGWATSSGGTGEDTAAMKDIATYQGANWSIGNGSTPGSIWGICGTANNGYPFLIDITAASC